MGSAQNVEVYRCAQCNEVVIIVPAGFTITEEEEREKAEAHLVQCRVTLERMLDEGAQDEAARDVARLDDGGGDEATEARVLSRRVQEPTDPRPGDDD